MANFNIESGVANINYKPLIVNYNVIRGSTGLTLKTVVLNIYKSFILGDNEQTINLDSGESSSVDDISYANPVGIPVSFIPDTITIESAPSVTLGTGASLTGSVTIEDSIGNPLSYPSTETITQDSATVGFVLKILNLITGTTASSIEINITVKDSGAVNSISKTIIVNVLNDS